MLYDYKDKIKICKDKLFLINGEKYYRIQCIEKYKDIYAKREIKKDEYGGYVHYLFADDYSPSHWLENYEIIGAPVTETAIISETTRESYNLSHSEILSHKKLIDEYISFCRFGQCGTKEPNVINAYLWNTDRIRDLCDEIYLYEEKIINKRTKPTDCELIILWSLLGSIAEAFLKLHVIILREKYNEFLKSQKNKYDNIKVHLIIEKILYLNDIDNAEAIFLHKLNGNRNMIHILNNGPIYNFAEYCIAVDNLFNIFSKLFNKQKAFIDQKSNN